MKKWFRLLERSAYFLVALMILVSTAWTSSQPNLQTESLQWASPNTIPGIDLDSYPPILVADQNKTVHAFLSQWIGDASDSTRAVVYTQWTPEYGWSSPIDIIVSPIYEARVTSAYLDKKGLMHVVFYGGNSVSGDIYYTSAYASAAGSATSWSTPIVIGEDAGDPESAVLVGDGQDHLSLVYHGRRDGYGVYVANSNDGGSTWSSPIPIFLSDGDAPYVSGIRAIISTSGWYHVVWDTYSQSGQGRTIYYTRAKIGDTEWSEPLALASVEEGLGTQTPTIIEYKGVLFAIYNLTPKITMRRSIDNGLTWDDPTVLFSRHVGVNGSLSLVIDGNDQMHLFFGQRITGSKGTPDMHGMWHSIWLNGRWTEPDAVIKGPRIVDKEGLSGFDPYEAHAIVSQGNVILVTWRTDPGDIKDNGVWYSYATLNAPEAPIATLQSPEVTAEVNPATVIVSTPTLQTEPTSTPIVFDKERQGKNPFVWMIVGLMVFGFLWILYVLFTRR
jgi:hypothetical protein